MDNTGCEIICGAPGINDDNDDNDDDPYWKITFFFGAMTYPVLITYSLTNFMDCCIPCRQYSTCDAYSGCLHAFKNIARMSRVSCDLALMALYTYK